MATYKLYTVCVKEANDSIAVYEDLFETDRCFCNMTSVEYNEMEYREILYQIRNVQVKIRTENKPCPYIGIYGLLYDDTPMTVNEMNMDIEDDMILVDGNMFIGLVLHGTFYHREIDGSSESKSQYERYVFVPIESEKYIHYYLDDVVLYDPPTDVQIIKHVKYALKNR